MRLRSIPVAAAVVASIVVGAPAFGAPPAPVPPPTRAQVIESMRLANVYWIANGPDQATNNWQNATFNQANLAYVTVFGKTNHYTLPWAQANKFLLPTDPARPFLAENYASGEAYLDLYKFHADPASLAALRDRVAAQAADVQAGQVREWEHVESIGLGMPVFARLAAMDSKPEYLDAMQALFRHSERTLYDGRRGLWARDTAAACHRTYWSRGNGFAIAGLARVIAALPAADPRRAEYAKIVTRMAASLARLQRPDGFWNVDLTSRRDHAGPETAGTALITDGIAAAINEGILPAATYRPVVERAWQGLTTIAEQPTGFLGYVQGPATGPSGSQPVKATDTAAYGVAAFLLAGAQLAAIES